jgi:hypothetical protein
MMQFALLTGFLIGGMQIVKTIFNLLVYPWFYF